jgi:glutamine synthetase
MHAAGIPIENSKGEWGPGQEEINVRYAEALDMADRHVILKNGAKEIAHQEGKADHLHGQVQLRPRRQFQPHPQFAVERRRQDAAVLRQEGAVDAVDARPAVVGGAAQICQGVHLVPLRPTSTPTSASRSGTFAPTKIMWSEDNRTAGFRLCGEGTKGIRMECRIGGADLNPYLAFAALIAAGLAGIDEKLELQKPFVGDAYQAAKLPEIPKTLREATETLAKSKMLKAALGEDVIEHYVHTARSGSSSNTTVASPTGNCTAASSGTKTAKQLTPKIEGES